ncbi:MAG: glucans biosynthesis glucosyltransferase MdoH, partial [Alphaproteobacteria bacterium]|nr:glucans biosynthesis glucosyltransferase MdoH [Alphaproteobacteria bacterium]
MVALRWLFFGLVLATTASAMSRLWEILRVDGLDTSEMLFLALVAILFCWISISFWIFCIGAYARWRGISGNTLTRPRDSDPQLRASLSRTALVFPVRNEEPGRFFAGISAVIASIRKNGVLDRFDFYILSDSTAPSNCGAEGEGYRRLHETSGATIYYRCRLENTGRKSGNIAEFCRNWGSLYDYMVVLDADSLMTAETLVALVRLM